jgi:hypothetical protein
MQPHEYEHNASDNSIYDDLANEPCVFLALGLHERIQSAVNLGHCGFLLLCRADGFPKVIEATARFMRPAGHAAARWGFPSPMSIVPWPCFRVTVPFLAVMVTSPFSTTIP